MDSLHPAAPSGVGTDFPPEGTSDESTLTVLGIQRVLGCTPNTADLIITLNSKNTRRNLTKFLDKSKDADWAKTWPQHKESVMA